MYKDYEKSFKNNFDKLSRIYGKYAVFSDFVNMCAISIYNSFAKNQVMEQEYLRTINSYEKEEQNIFSKMFGELIMMYEEANDIIDILGPFYEKENLGNSHIGQFFTPTPVSNFMSEISVGDENTLKENIKKKWIYNNGRTYMWCWSV